MLGYDSINHDVPELGKIRNRIEAFKLIFDQRFLFDIRSPFNTEFKSTSEPNRSKIWKSR